MNAFLKYFSIVAALVQISEAAKGPGTGPEKEALVRTNLNILIQNTAPNLLPQDANQRELLDNVVSAIIKYEVARMNKSGELPKTQTTP